MVPEARVDVMPPIEASAPGSIGKKSPVPRSSALSCFRVIPGCTTTSMSLSCTVSTLFMRAKSKQTPPATAAALPSSEVPAPNGTMGIFAPAHSLTISATSCVVSGKTTMSGGRLR
ncbi:hypothetical protein ACVWW7_006489 [Bradyrhizobium sp. LM6.9]